MHTAAGSASAALLAGMDGGCPFVGIITSGRVEAVVGATASARLRTTPNDTIRTPIPGRITAGTDTDTVITGAAGMPIITEVTLTRTGPIVIERSGIGKTGGMPMSQPSLRPKGY